MKAQRKNKLYRLQFDAWYGMQLSKLGAVDMGIINKFVDDHGETPLEQWEMAVNRLFLDYQEKKKPKNWTLIMEILTVIGKVKPRPEGFNWESTGPDGCDSHCVPHPCGHCYEEVTRGRK